MLLVAEDLSECRAVGPDAPDRGTGRAL